MKRIASLILTIACLAALLCGCGGQTSPGLTPESKGNESISGEITAYVGDYYVYDFDSAIKAFEQAFPHVELNLQIFQSMENEVEQVTKDLENDTLPDLIVCMMGPNAYDLGQLATDGRLLDLGPILEQDQGFRPDDYYTETFSAGQFDGKQVLLPISFSLDVAYCRESVYQDSGLQLEEGYTTADVFNGILDFCDRFDAENAGYPYPLLSLPSVTSYVDVLQLAGVELFDPQTRTLSFPNNEVPQDLMDFCAAYYDRQVDFYTSQVIGYHPNGESAVMSYCSQNVGFSMLPLWMDTMRLFSIETLMQVKGETLRVIPIPQYNDPTKYAAQVEMCGGIAANSKNPEAAYALLRTLMDFEMKNTYGFSVRRSNNDAALQKARDKEMQFADTLANMLEHIGTAQLAPSAKLYVVLEERLKDLPKDVPQEALFEAVYGAIEYYLTDPPFNANMSVRYY